MESVFSSALVRNEGSMLLAANSFLKVRVLNLLPYIAIFSLLYMYWSTFCAYRSPNVIQAFSAEVGIGKISSGYKFISLDVICVWYMFIDLTNHIVEVL